MIKTVVLYSDNRILFSTKKWAIKPCKGMAKLWIHATEWDVNLKRIIVLTNGVE